MKTNFFEQIAGLKMSTNLLLNIHRNEQDELTVSASINNSIGLPPLLFKGTAQELDEGFIAAISEPVKETIGLINNLEAYQKELAKKKNAKHDKAAKAADDAEDEPDDEKDNNLFTPKEDDKEAKAEKKRLYDEAMDKVKELAQNTKYAEALSHLPDAADYPEKADAIETKRKTLQAGKDAYDKLTASFND